MTQDSEPNRCPRCGASLTNDAPGGHCLRCLAQMGVEEFAVGEDTPLSTGNPAHADFLLGDYELLGEIARGGMGVVYRARQRSLNRIVALKVILSGRFASLHEVLRFRAEAEAAANLHHPNIVAIHEIGDHQGQHFFSMEYVPGQNLSALTRKGPLPAGEAARLARTIAEAIDYAHQQNILHRDLKPSNVILDVQGQPRITDFGLAKRLSGDLGLTLTGQAMGSPGFMPPEQTLARHAAAGPPSDVYGVGAILYHLLTGRPPFQAETVDQVLLQLRETDPVPLRLLNPGVPRDLETICLRCLEKKPEGRYPTAQALAADLGRFLAGEPVHARPVSALARAGRWCRRQPAIAGLLAAIVLIAAGGFAAVLWQLRKTEQANRQFLDLVAEQLRIATEHPKLRSRELLDLRKDLLQVNVPFLDGFAASGQASSDLALRGVVAYQTLAATLSVMGQRNEALTNAVKARALGQSLVRDHPGLRAARREWAEASAFLGKQLRFAGRLSEAEAMHLEAIGLSEPLVRADRAEAEFGAILGDHLADYATFLLSTGRLEEGRSMYQRAMTELRGIRPNNAREAAAIDHAIILAILRGEAHLAWYEPAQSDRTNALSEALRLGWRLAQGRNLSAEDQYQLANLRTFLGEAQAQVGAISDAEQSLFLALQEWDALLALPAQEPKFSLGKAAALERLGTVQAAAKRWAEAERAWEASTQALPQSSANTNASPGADSVEQAGHIYAARARSLAAQRRLTEAVDWMRQARALQERLIISDPPQPRYLAPLARLLGEQAELLVEVGQTNEARDALLRAHRGYEQLIAAAPKEPYWRRQAAAVTARLQSIPASGVP